MMTRRIQGWGSRLTGFSRFNTVRIAVVAALMVQALVSFAADLQGEVRVAPASPNIEVGGTGYLPTWSREPEGRILYPLIPVERLLILASPTGEEPAEMADPDTSHTLRLSQAALGDVWTAVPVGVALEIENDSSRALQVRHSSSGEMTVVDANSTTEVFPDGFTNPGIEAIEVQTSQGRFFFVVVDGPFAVGRLQYAEEGRFRLDFGDVIEGRGPSEASFAVSVWFAGRRLCLDTSAACAIELSGTRAGDRVTLSPLMLLHSHFLETDPD